MSEEQNNSMMEYYEQSSSRIKEGASYTLYYMHCKDCKKYKRILASPPMGPGGTISCPYCKAAKKNGPGIEGSYGNIKTKPFLIKLPKNLES